MTTQTTIRMPIYGLGCGGGGASSIERELARTPGVVRVYLNPASEAADIDFEPALTNAVRPAALVEQLGYRAGQPVED